MHTNHSHDPALLAAGRRIGGMLALSAALLLTAPMIAARAQAQRSPILIPVPLPGNGDKAPLSPNVRAQILALEAEKEARTPSQRKIDSQLLYAGKMARHQAIARGVTTLKTTITQDKNGLTLVDIDARNTVPLLKQIMRNGVIVNNFPRLNTIRASVPLTLIPTLAANPDVKFIRPAVPYRLSGRKISALPDWRARHAPPSPPALPFASLPFAPAPFDTFLPAPSSPLDGFLSPAFAPTLTREARLRRTLPELVARMQKFPAAAFSLPQNRAARFGALSATTLNMGMLTGLTVLGSEFLARTGPVTSEGDATHRADIARGIFGVDGTGITIGVLSSGVDSLGASQSAGELGPVTVLPGQAGSGDEGTAMLEIVHDLAPGAGLYFATADGGPSVFADNIRNLRAAGCDIIVDDVFYLNESPFQDGPVAQAVNDVTANGGLYFSSAGNQGNKDDNTATVWQGDFNDGGPVTIETTGGTDARLHSFGASVLNTANVVGGQFLAAILTWSDPLGASSNDYDLYVLDNTGSSVVDASTDTQNGLQDPFEIIGVSDGQQLVIVKRADAAPRFLRVNIVADDGASTLAFSTIGQTFGHSSAVNAFAVAATPALASYPDPFNGRNVVETFSSDGPRRVFFNADGTAITPGNFSSTGGAIRNKPDITAADGVSTSVNGFNPFYGTSAAAPHAAAIAGLLKSYNPMMTPAQTRTALQSTTIDIMASGYDRDSGFGILDAAAALNGIPGGAVTSLTLKAASVSGGATAQGTVTLLNPASTGGAVVTLSASPAGIASVPASVTVPAGKTTVNFPITTTAVTENASVLVAAKYSGSARFTTLNVTDLYLISGTVTTLDAAPVSGVSLTASGTGIAALPTQTVSPNTPIPDGLDDSGNNPGDYIFAPLTFPGTGTVNSVQVGVNITHPFRGDLLIALFAPDNDYVILQVPGPDPAADVITSYPDLTVPYSSLSAFVGKPVAGNWHLYVQDYYSGLTGTLNSFSLTLVANGVPITLSTSTGSDGTYSFANQRSGTFTLTPAKAGFDFIPHSLPAAIGPNQTSQSFTLSQTGVRVTTTAAFVGGAYQITVTCANNAKTSAGNTQITRAILGAVAAPTSPALPASLGTLASGSAGSVTLTYPVSAGARGSKVLLRLSGASSLGSFGGSLQITLP